MSDFDRINKPRIDKIMAIIDTIETSANSNREDAGRLLRCVSDRLAGSRTYCNPNRPAMPAPGALGRGLPGAGSLTPQGMRIPQWASVRQMAEQADLSDLTVALAVYMNRVDEALSK